MKTDTTKRIINYLSQKEAASPKELVDFLGLKPSAVFKQLKKLRDKNQIGRSGLPPKVFYHLLETKPSIPQENVTKNLSGKNEKIINQNFLFVSPSGEMWEGTEGFSKWCERQNLPVVKTAVEYVKTLDKYGKYKKHGMISGMYKVKNTFPKVFLDELYYLDFYSIERFGKTKLGSLLLYAKQSQNIHLMKKISLLIKTTIESLITKKKIEAVAFIPPTVKREIQFQKEMEKLLALKLPKISLTKIISPVVVPQKTLSKLEDRIENARRTLFVKSDVPYGKILLFDDAVGSGATLNETARKIKENTGKKIKIIGLAITGSYKGFEVLNEV